MSRSEPHAGRIVGLDYGERRVGVAVSDPLRLTAQPVAVLAVGDRFEAELQKLIDEYDPDLIVIGLPTSLAGTEGPVATAAREFGHRVARGTGVAVAFHDERFTSIVAERALLEADVRRVKRKNIRDKVAAAVMLQSYLDERRQ